MRRALWVAAAVALSACGHGAEALRDEQARTRRYRDAYESLQIENDQLKERLKSAEQAAAACQPPPSK
jgi:hypothetical protein